MKKRVKKIVSRAVNLVGCAGVGVVGVAVDVPALLGIAVVKSPVLLCKGCSWCVCLPVTTAMVLLWPLHVLASIGSAVLYSVAKGLYGAVVTYQENSITCGLKHVVAAVAEYDELTNDVTNLRPGSCLPRPNYHRKKKDSDAEDEPEEHVAVTVIREFDLNKLVEYLQSSQGRATAIALLDQGVLKGTSVAWTLLCFLLDSEFGKVGLQTEPTLLQRGPARVVEYDPLEILQYQIQHTRLEEVEEEYLESLVLDDGDAGEIAEQLEPMRKATLQGFSRRIGGIAAFVSRNPEFMKHYVEYLRGALAASRDMISFDSE